MWKLSAARASIPHVCCDRELAAGPCVHKLSSHHCWNRLWHPCGTMCHPDCSACPSKVLLKASNIISELNVPAHQSLPLPDPWNASSPLAGLSGLSEKMRVNPKKLRLIFFGLCLNSVWAKQFELQLIPLQVWLWKSLEKLGWCYCCAGERDLFGTAGGSPGCQRGLLARLMSHYYAGLKKKSLGIDVIFK